MTMERRHARRRASIGLALLAGLCGGCQAIVYTPTDVPGREAQVSEDFPAIGATIAPPTNPPLSSAERYRIMQELEIARDRNAALAARRAAR